MLNQKLISANSVVKSEQFLRANTLLIGALAWRGYVSKNRGVVVVCGLGDTEGSPTDNLRLELDYFSKEEAKQNYPEGIALFQLVDEYDPRYEIVAIFTDKERRVIDGYSLRLTVPPAECYILLQEQMLELDCGSVANSKN